jgi:fatty acid desaturase
LAESNVPQQGQPRRPVRDREVVIAAALVVAFVLIVAWLTGLVPALDNAIGLAPVVIIGLILVTVLVLARALIPRRR